MTGRIDIAESEIPKYTTGDTRNKLQGESGSNQLKVGIDAKFEWDVINPKRRLEIEDEAGVAEAMDNAVHRAKMMGMLKEDLVDLFTDAIYASYEENA